ncbi:MULTISPECIES: DUF2865 domain-containing protein [unclassified Nitrobacter]|uniref:DUF2865 domain-containing protein n=1 Tax=unclassified Nitrobacter TaxID=2620411 RepID=UPI0009268057|nr:MULTISPECIES: DUF2865 domain-containing protein [unclassified Nitrobacter]MBN9147542.1 DUF2865 domain-containing protein [Nitrobacter sp.]OJV02068.1 MAG: hypothetical protein BGO16_04325 [Nitrobacter sp. 62-23]
MPDLLFARRLMRLLACAGVLGLGVATPAGDAMAQSAPGANPICPRLEAQLASIERGGAEPARAGQIRRYEDAAGRQQAELERVTAQARRMGCDSSGFFALFNGQSQQCGPVTQQIQRMRTNLEQITTSLERLRAGNGGPDHDNQRRSVLIALAQNNCGPQYAAAVRNQGNFFDNLFGNSPEHIDNAELPPADTGVQSGTYRTVCARSCDGFYFPISFATVPSRFADDERTCKNLCPAADATLYAYRNPGEDMNQAVSINGQPYSSSPNAFRYRQEFNPSCSCKAAGQTWSEALKGLDDKATAAQQGDIIVTEDGAKKMSQGGGNKGSQKKDAAAAPANAPATTSAVPTGSAPATNKPIRSVGPTFIPAQ